MTDFTPFALEEYQSRHERNVAINLADSGVQCLSVGAWLTADERQALLEGDLFYPEVNGTRALREAIAACYPGAGPDNVLVTVGASQANALVAETLLSPGDEVVTISPGYRQIWGLAKNRGCRVLELPLDEANGWALDLDRLESLVGPRTKLVSVVNPNNPAGTVLDAEERRRIAAICDRVGAWLHADEVYGGTEFAGGPPTPSFWGLGQRLLCVNSLSKAYGLAGLRIGWIVASAETIEALWRRHEYAVIAAAAPSMYLAALALRPGTRRRLLDRQRDYSRAGRLLIEDWVRRQQGRFSLQPAAATSLAFVRYATPLTSLEMAELIRREADVLVAPGSALGAERHLRIAVGYDQAKVAAALERIQAVTESL